MWNISDLKLRLKRIPALQPVVRAIRNVKKQQMRRRADALLPQAISIELTNECNLRCAKCPTYEAQRGRGMMEMDVYRKILADVRAAGCPVEIGLSGGGESLLHERLIDFISMARKVPNVTRVGLATNGIALANGIGRKMLDAGLSRLKLSLDADSAQSYLKLNRVDAYEMVVRNITDFCRIKKAGNYDCEVTLKITLYKDDRELVERLKKMWAAHVDQIRVTSLHNWLGLRGQRQGQQRTEPCDQLWSMIQILWNGQLTLCCFDSMEGFFNMGNVRNINLSEYWQWNRQLIDIRNAHLAGDFSQLKICATCNVDQYESLTLSG
jgi:MoaA/NifB/PqqE/SkfB family radical SAM enzyme